MIAYTKQQAGNMPVPTVKKKLAAVGDPSGSSSRMPILIVVMVHGLHVILAAVPNGMRGCKSFVSFVTVAFVFASII